MLWEKVQRADKIEILSKPVDGLVSTSRTTLAIVRYNDSGSKSFRLLPRTSGGCWAINWSGREKSKSENSRPQQYW